jgi:hypothetical protein
VAGTKRHDGYITIKLFRVSFLVHRLAWALHTGAWPEDQIDHINRDPSDNRVVNLRESTDRENNRNLGRSVKNTSGVTGVLWDKSKGKWSPRIQVMGRTVNLGRTDSFEEAVARRKAAEINYGFSPTHGLPNQEIA